MALFSTPDPTGAGTQNKVTSHTHIMYSCLLSQSTTCRAGIGANTLRLCRRRVSVFHMLDMTHIIAVAARAAGMTTAPTPTTTTTPRRGRCTASSPRWRRPASTYGTIIILYLNAHHFFPSDFTISKSERRLRHDIRTTGRDLTRLCLRLCIGVKLRAASVPPIAYHATRASPVL